MYVYVMGLFSFYVWMVGKDAQARAYRYYSEHQIKIHCLL